MCLARLLHIFYSTIKPSHPIKAICELCLKGEKAGVTCFTTARVGKNITSARKAVTFYSQRHKICSNSGILRLKHVTQRLNLWGGVGEEW